MVQDVRKIYKMGDSEVHALKGMSLAVRPGELVAIMGTSGSGKSTLLQIMGCLDRPTDGNVYIDGQDVGTMPDPELAKVRNKKLGFIFQSFNLMPHETAAHNVEIPLQYAGIGRKERRQLAVQALVTVGLGDRVDHKPAELSGGQRQRVAIARAIVNQPLVILADEPTGALDVKSGLDVMNILQEFNRQGRTIIMVTHDPGIAEHAQRIIRISDGIVVDEEVVSSPRLAGAESVSQVAPAAVKPDAVPRDVGVPCSSCGTDNRPAVRYCRNCGLPLEEAEALMPGGVPGGARCRVCDIENRTAARFCRSCGAKTDEPLSGAAPR